MVVEKKRLGRGLSGLLGEASGHGGSGEYDESWPLNRLRPNPEQPRQVFDEVAMAELADSIKAHGVLQPILARRDGDSATIVAGERRYRAAYRAGLLTVPVRFIEADDRTTQEVALVENLQRENLAPLELAEALSDLMERFGLTQEELAGRLGWSRSAVANKLRLLTLPESIRRALSSGDISEGHARALLSLDAPEQVERVLAETMRLNWSVRQVENRVRNLLATSGTAPITKPRHWRPRSASRLARDLGVKCSIVGLEDDNSLTLSGLSRLQIRLVCALLESNVAFIKQAEGGIDSAFIEDEDLGGAAQTAFETNGDQS